MNIPIQKFTYYEVCESPFEFSYYLTQATSNGVLLNQLPSFFILDTVSLASSSKLLLNVTASAPTDVGLYEISLTGVLPNHQSLKL
jgi:hypothetical protein